jgi:hypothetical protein
VARKRGHHPADSATGLAWRCKWMVGREQAALWFATPPRASLGTEPADAARLHEPRQRRCHRAGRELSVAGPRCYACCSRKGAVLSGLMEDDAQPFSFFLPSSFLPAANSLAAFFPPLFPPATFSLAIASFRHSKTYMRSNLISSLLEKLRPMPSAL